MSSESEARRVVDSTGDGRTVEARLSRLENVVARLDSRSYAANRRLDALEEDAREEQPARTGHSATCAIWTRTLYTVQGHREPCSCGFEDQPARYEQDTPGGIDASVGTSTGQPAPCPDCHGTGIVAHGSLGADGFDACPKCGPADAPVDVLDAWETAYESGGLEQVKAAGRYAVMMLSGRKPAPTRYEQNIPGGIDPSVGTSTGKPAPWCPYGGRGDGVVCKEVRNHYHDGEKVGHPVVLYEEQLTCAEYYAMKPAPTPGAVCFVCGGYDRRTSSAYCALCGPRLFGIGTGREQEKTTEEPCATNQNNAPSRASLPPSSPSVQGSSSPSQSATGSRDTASGSTLASRQEKTTGPAALSVGESGSNGSASGRGDDQSGSRARSQVLQVRPSPGAPSDDEQAVRGPRADCGEVVEQSGDDGGSPQVAGGEGRGGKGSPPVGEPTLASRLRDAVADARGIALSWEDRTKRSNALATIAAEAASEIERLTDRDAEVEAMWKQRRGALTRAEQAERDLGEAVALLRGWIHNFDHGMIGADGPPDGIKTRALLARVDREGGAKP